MSCYPLERVDFWGIPSFWGELFLTSGFNTLLLRI